MNAPNNAPPNPDFQMTLDLNLLGKFFAQEINQVPLGRARDYVRTALSKAFKRYEDHIGNYQFNARINIDEETFEKLAAAYTKIVEQHEEQTAKGAVNTGGVYIQTVSDGEFHDLTKDES